jgi:2-keto-4-pentenoate hydratase
VNRDNIKRAVENLIEAWQMGQVLAGWPEGCRPTTLAEAYRIQNGLNAELGVADAGWKIGATSDAARSMLKAKGPFYGRVLAPRIFPSGVSLPASAYAMRGLEGEFAFRLGRDLKPRAKSYSRREVLAAVESVHPAIEIVDTRFGDFDKAGGIHGIIADQGANAALVLGKKLVWRPERDLAKVAVRMAVNGTTVAEGTGAMVMGDPVVALMWLANEQRKRAGLKSGAVVTTGTCTGLYRAQKGDAATASFGKSATVSVSFI